MSKQEHEKYRKDWNRPIVKFLIIFIALLALFITGMLIATNQLSEARTGTKVFFGMLFFVLLDGLTFSFLRQNKIKSNPFYRRVRVTWRIFIGLVIIVFYTLIEVFDL